jgi:hypothetical protein
MPLKVIGAGLGRTGTMSLKLALEQLGFGPCYHMVEVFKLPDAPGQWSAAADGEAVDWERVFEGFNSTVDWPSASFYRQLADAYPEAKVILTERDADAWYRSTQATIFNVPPPQGEPTPWHLMVRKVIGGMFDGDMATKEHVIEVYRRHNDEVRRTIPPERLLIYDVAEGWGPLCAFLGVEVPAGPMPKVNSTEEFQARIRPAVETAFQAASV